MLCQLVCVDRRYQRMNCFNIRELQGILKRKFFTDLINSNDHRELFDKSMIGLRFKNNNQLNINHDMSIFYNFGTTNTPKTKQNTLVNLYSSNEILTNLTSMSYIPSNSYALFSSLTNSFNYLLVLLKDVLLAPLNVHFATLSSLLTSPKHLTNFIALNTNLNLNLATTNTYKNQTNTSFENTTSFTSDNILSTDSSDLSSSMMSELSSTFRYTRFNNPLISYDYKCGNYLGI